MTALVRVQPACISLFGSHVGRPSSRHPSAPCPEACLAPLKRELSSLFCTCSLHVQVKVRIQLGAQGSPVRGQKAGQCPL